MVRLVSLLAAVSLFMTTALSAQVDDRDRARRDARRKAVEVMREMKNAELPKPKETPVEERVLQPGMLRSYMAPMVNVVPRRVPPGASGTLKLVFALQRDSVLRPGDRFLLTYERTQGTLSFGDWQLEPPKEGTLETTFQGQPIYDNTVIVSIPFGVAGDAEHGKHELQMELEADVARGSTGFFHGRYSMEVRGNVTVGQPVPTPAVRRKPNRSDSVEPQPAPVADATADRPEIEQSGARVIASEPTDVTAEPPPSEDDGSVQLPDPILGDEDPSPWGILTFVLIGGGFLAILLLALRRR